MLKTYIYYFKRATNPLRPGCQTTPIFIQSQSYIWPFEGNRKAAVALGEDEFDNPASGFGRCFPNFIYRNATSNAYWIGLKPD